MDKTIQIDTFTRFTQVSRETITSLKKYEKPKQISTRL